MRGMMQNGRQDWETPPAFFAALDAEFGFTLDACALPHNAKCERFYSPEDDALLKDWRGVVWCNPPYGVHIGRWVKHAYRQALKGATVVMLIPASTDTRWWHTYVMRASEIRLVKGRISFVGGGPAPFPCAVVVFGNGEGPRLSAISAQACTDGVQMVMV